MISGVLAQEQVVRAEEAPALGVLAQVGSVQEELAAAKAHRPLATILPKSDNQMASSKSHHHQTDPPNY